MANIYCVKDGGSYHWNDPSAWTGGVVPTGSGDTAYIQHEFTRINSGSGYHYWEGVRDRIVVDSGTNFASTSGSFFTWVSPSMFRVQITYDSKDGNSLLNCRISSSYSTWTDEKSGSFDVGFIRNDTPVFTQPTTIYLSGSSTWHISRIFVEDQAQFIMKDKAHLRLDSTSQDATVYVRDGVFEALDNVTASLAGTTERNSGFVYHDGYDYGSVKISGSSDYRQRTTITGDTSLGAGTLTVGDSSGFGVGDFISVYHEDNHVVHWDKASGTDNWYADYYKYSRTGSIFSKEGKFLARKGDSIRDENEVLQVVGTGSNQIHVKKIFGKEGTVIQTTSFSKGRYQRERGVANFTGNKTSITVRSEHNRFKVGDKLSINGNTHTILNVRDKLIPYKYIDFTNGGSLEPDFIFDRFMGSGSGIKHHNTADVVSGSFGLTMSGSLVGTTDDISKRFFLKDTRLRDFRVTLVGSQLRHYDNNHTSNRWIAILAHAELYSRDRIGRDEFYAMYNYGRDTYNGVYYDDHMSGNYPWGYTQFDISDRINTYPGYSGVADVNAGDITLMTDSLRETTKHYYNGKFINQFMKRNQVGGIGFQIRRENAAVKTFKVEEYVQEMILDTSIAIPNGSKVYETGAVAHSTGQKVVKLANTIKDLRGYKDLTARWPYEPISGSFPNISGSIIPIFWDRNGDKTLHLTSDTNDNRSRNDAVWRKSRRQDYYLRTTNNNADAYIAWNLGQDVTMDAIGISMYYDGWAGQTMDAFTIEHSNNGYTWTTARDNVADTRKAYQGKHRIFTFNEITCRFIRIKLNGTSQSSNNYINKISLHHFNGRGNTLELNNAADIEVGNRIVFIQPQGDGCGEEYNPRLATAYRSEAQAGNINNSNTVGGITTYYTVTAKTGNVITVDRPIEGKLLHYDTMVVKLDRAIQIYSESHIPFGPYGTNGNVDEQVSCELVNFTALSMGNGSRERMYFYVRPDAGKVKLANYALNFIEQQSTYAPGGPFEVLNGVVLNASTIYFSYNQENGADVNHGNIFEGQDPYFRGTSGMDGSFTGNFFISFRYLSINYTSGNDFANRGGKTIIRNNYFKSNDYTNIYFGDEHSTALLSEFDMYDNIISNSAISYMYIRPYPEMFARPFTTKNRVELFKEYPHTFAQNGIHIRNMNNIQPYMSMGRDYQMLQPFYTNEQTSYRPYLVDDSRMQIITNDVNSSHYDIYFNHQSRTGARMFMCLFKVYEEQTVNIDVVFDYMMDPGPMLSTRSTNNRKILLTIVGDDHRTLEPAHEFPHQGAFQKQTYNNSFTMKPGSYGVILSKYSPPYSVRMFTFKESSCTIKGSKPSQIDVYSNNFSQYLLLKNKNLLLRGFDNKIGQDVTLNNPQRTTVKFRKFRF